MRYHHEKYDGSGYPYGVKGDEIPLTAHIMIVADALDAMTSNRIYQARKSIDEAIDELLLYRGIWYSPDVVDATVKALKIFDKDDKNVSQIPVTQMEKARFSYYFKDQLTGAYNESYLKMITEGMIENVFYQFFILVEIQNMSEYNTKYGWHMGNQFIQNVCNILLDDFGDEQVFRLFGDDFVVGCNEEEYTYESLKLIEKKNLSDVNARIISIHELHKMLAK